MRKLALLLALLASPAFAQNTFPPSNPGDMIVKGNVGAWTYIPGGTAGCALISNGPTAAASWQCSLGTGFNLPPIPTNRVFGNVSGVQAIPTAITVNQWLDTIGYDTLRTPTNGSLIAKDPATGTWQAIVPPSVVGQVLTSAGTGQLPVWAAPGGIVAPGVPGTCLVSNGFALAPSYQGCLLSANNLSDLTSAVTARTNLGLGPLATLASPLPIANGGTAGTDKQSAFDALAPTATRAGDITYWNGTHYVNLAGNNAGTKVLTQDASGVPTWGAAGAGTVTSVAMTVPSFLSVAGSPVTTTGTLAVTLATESANTIFAGPTSGGAVAPAFRTMVLGDIPAIAAYSLLGNFTNASAAPQASTIGSLTEKVSPAATDLLLLQDQAASGQLKKVQISAVASAGSVSSIAGNTGAFTLSGGITNSTNDIRTATVPVARSSNTILGTADRGAAIIATSTFTQTLTAAATLTSGWWIHYRNNGTGVITLDPNGSETVNGATTWNLYPGEGVTIICDGSNFTTVGGSTGRVLLDTQTASGSAFLSFTRFDSTRFASYVFEFDDLFTVSATQQLSARFSVDGGSSYLSTAIYYYNGSLLTTANTQVNYGTVAASQWVLSGLMTNAAGNGVSGTVELIPGSNARGKVFVSYVGSDGSISETWGSVIGVAANVNGMLLFGSSGNITGVARMYGIAK